MKSNFIYLLPVSFIFFASFLGSAPYEGDILVLKMYSLPRILHDIAYVFYLILIILFCFFGIARVSKHWRLFKPFFILVFSYFILLFWALVTANDYVRYFVIFLSVLLCPIGLLYVIEETDFKFFSKSVFYTFCLFVFLSVVYSFLNYATHPRVSGIHNNPNLMGIWLISLLTVALYLKDYINRSVFFLFLVVVSVLIILTGSRLAFAALFIMYTPIFLKFKFFSFLSLAFLIAYFLGNGNSLDMGFRAIEIGSAVSDSGRSLIWDRAIECINTELLVGHGMGGAESCVKIGNVHNSYLRIAVMLGIPLAILFFLSYFFFLAKVLTTPVNVFIKLYFIGLPIAFFAEDYLVGFASPFFPFFLFMLALLLFDLKKRKALIKEVKL